MVVPITDVVKMTISVAIYLVELIISTPLLHNASLLEAPLCKKSGGVMMV